MNKQIITAKFALQQTNLAAQQTIKQVEKQPQIHTNNNNTNESYINKQQLTHQYAQQLHNSLQQIEKTIKVTNIFFYIG
jgi:hypothetical protein